MKEKKVKEQLEILKGFLTNIKSIANHPYALGVNVNKLVDDLTDFVNDVEKILDEDAAAEILAEKPEEKTTEEAVAEESEKAE